VTRRRFLISEAGDFIVASVAALCLGSGLPAKTGRARLGYLVHAKVVGSGPMKRMTLFSGSVLAILSFGVGPTTAHMAGTPATLDQWAAGARLFDGLGNFHRSVTTSSTNAQAYFDQGVRFLWAFNHDEASRSFAHAAQLDPTCAMCFWGVALTVGPNYNLPMTAEPRAKVAWDALQQAQANAPHTTPVEQALITALVARYPDSAPRDPSNEGSVLTAYANAMQGVAQAFPTDSDVQTLTAEAQMNVNAWKLWALDGAATAGTNEIVARLEGVLAKDPQHAARGPICRGSRSESQRGRRGPGIFRANEAPRLLCDVHCAQLPVPCLFHGNGGPQGRHNRCNAEGPRRYLG
jgi:hypothetical protein